MREARISCVPVLDAVLMYSHAWAKHTLLLFLPRRLPQLNTSQHITMIYSSHAIHISVSTLSPTSHSWSQGMITPMHDSDARTVQLCKATLATHPSTKARFAAGSFSWTCAQRVTLAPKATCVMGCGGLPIDDDVIRSPSSRELPTPVESRATRRKLPSSRRAVASL